MPPTFLIDSLDDIRRKVKLYSLAERSDYKVTDLQKATRVDVANGVEATSLQKAREIVGRLKDRLLPYCPEDAAPSGTSPPSDPAASGSAAPTSAGATPSPAPTDTPAPTSATSSTSGSASASSSAPARPDNCRPRP